MFREEELIMGIVIGAATLVDFGGACVVSAQWGVNPNTQRLYCLGEWSPRDDFIFEKPTETMSLTIYSPSGVTYATEPTTDCVDANTVTASVTSLSTQCPTGPDFTGDWFVNSYSYSKDDAVMPAQETWGLIRWVAGTHSTPIPTVLRGIAEGQASDEDLTGITFTGDTVTSQTGNVTAGGFGKAYDMEIGVVVQVGNGLSTAGETGQGSVNIPYTPLWLEA